MPTPGAPTPAVPPLMPGWLMPGSRACSAPDSVASTAPTIRMCPNLFRRSRIALPPLMAPCNPGSRPLNHVHRVVALTRRAVIDAAALQSSTRRRPSPSLRLGCTAFDGSFTSFGELKVNCPSGRLGGRSSLISTLTGGYPKDRLSLWDRCCALARASPSSLTRAKGAGEEGTSGRWRLSTAAIRGTVIGRRLGDLALAVLRT